MVLSTTYFGNQHYYALLLRGGTIDLHEHYLKQSYRNRCDILSGNGPLSLIVPVLQPAGVKRSSNEIRIDPSKRWQHRHWQALVSAYRNSPYFEHYEGELAPIYRQRWELLSELNKALQELLLKWLGRSPSIHYSEAYLEGVAPEQDFRVSLSPKKRLQRRDSSFTPPRYYQVFGERFDFVPNLSTLDLLFCEGPYATALLEAALNEG